MPWLRDLAKLIQNSNNPPLYVGLVLVLVDQRKRLLGGSVEDSTESFDLFAEDDLGGVRPRCPASFNSIEVSCPRSDTLVVSKEDRSA